MVGEPLMFYIKCKACVISTINNITVPISEAAHSTSLQPHVNRHEIMSTTVTFIKYMRIEDAAYCPAQPMLKIRRNFSFLLPRYNVSLALININRSEAENK